MPVILAAFIMLSMVSTSGRRRRGPKAMARFAGLILFLSQCSPTLDKNNNNISANALFAAGKSSTNFDRDSIYFTECVSSFQFYFFFN